MHLEPHAYCIFNGDSATFQQKRGGGSAACSVTGFDILPGLQPAGAAMHAIVFLLNVPHFRPICHWKHHSIHYLKAAVLNPGTRPLFPHMRPIWCGAAGIG